MRLSKIHRDTIRELARDIFGQEAQVFLFGSRVDDQAKGGDLDLLVETPDCQDEPAVLIARFASRVSQRMGGRKVDVILYAPNLQVLPIHTIAKYTGIRL